MDFDFELDWAENGLAPELAGLRRGDTVSAEQFLSWFAGRDETEALAAAMQMEQMGIGLSVRGFTPIAKETAAAERLLLEEKLVAEGRLEQGLPEDDVLALTLAEYGSAVPLSDGAAEMLWQKAKNGDTPAVEALTQGCLGRISHMTREFVGKGVLLQDLLQEGCLALWQTIAGGTAENFLEEALWAARQAMGRLVVLEALGDHIGRSLAQDLEQYQKTELSLLQKLGRTPSNEEIAHAMSLTPEQTDTLAKMAREAARMQKNAPQKPEQTEQEAERPVEDSAYFALRSRVEELLSGLEEADRELVSLRFGLSGQPPMTEDQVGLKLGIPASEVLRREGEALAALRKEK